MSTKWLVLIFCTVLAHTNGSPLLLLSTDKDVRVVDAESPDYEAPLVTISGHEDSMADQYLDYHLRAGLVCWSDITQQIIQCVQQNTTEVVLRLTDIPCPEGISVDWLTDSLYWVDSKMERLEVVGLYSPHYRRVLYWTSLSAVNAIVTVPTLGIVFWSTRGTSAKIEVGSMAGNYRRTLVSKNLQLPNGLTTDTTRQTLYWAEAHQNNPSIHAVDFNGNNRREVLHEGLSRPFSLSYFDRNLYWTDWNTRSIHTCTLNKLNLCRPQHQISLLNNTNYLRVYSSLLQPHSNDGEESICSLRNCSHLCLHSPPSDGSEGVSAFCSCPTGIKLLEDGMTCGEAPGEFLLLSRPSGLYRVSLETEDHTVMPLEYSDKHSNETRHHATDVDYDPIEDEIYWVDVEEKAVRATKEFKGNVVVTRTVFDGLDGNDGFALDVAGRNFYWTDEKRHCIQVASFDGKAHKILIWEDVDHPRAITVHSQLNFLFWTDWGVVPKIERASVDGSGRRVIVNTNIGWPNGIVLDETSNLLYWIDAATELQRIERCRFDGSKREVILEEPIQHLSGLTILHSTLYWPEIDERLVSSMELKPKDGRYRRLDFLRNTANVNSMKAVQRNVPLVDYWDNLFVPSESDVPCFVNKSGCSHLCFRDSTKSYHCSCPHNLDLSSDNHTCVDSEDFLLYFGEKNVLYRTSLDYHSPQSLPLSPVKSTTSLAYDPIEGFLYRTVGASIWKSHFNGSASAPVVKHGLLLPHSIALDFISKNIYWTDVQLNRIECSRLDGSSRRVLAWKDLVKPYTLAVEPVTRYLFWSEMGTDTSGIIKSSWLDGSHVRVLVSSNIGRQIALAVGLSNSADAHMFWFDSDNRKLSTITHDGFQRRVLVPKLPSGSSGISVHRERVYWTSPSGSHSYSLYSANADDGKDTSITLANLTLSENIFTVTGTVSAGTLSSNPCVLNNGDCSHLCLPTPSTTHTCACPTHYTLAEDGRSCLSPSFFLIYGQSNDISRIVEPEAPSMVLSLKGVRNVGAIAYDPVTQTVYWIDRRNKRVLASFENSNKKQTVLDGSELGSHPTSICLDTISGLLYISCGRSNTVNVTRQVVVHDSIVYTNLGTVIGNPSDRPRVLAIHARYRLLFFVNMVEPLPQIEVSLLDGTKRRVLVNTGLVEPISLSVDDGDRPTLYWFDVVTRTISGVTIDGTNKRVVLSQGLQNVVSLASHGDWLYFVDAHTNRIAKVRPADGYLVTVMERLSDLVDIVTVDVREAQKYHPCSRLRDTIHCSDVCVGTEAPRDDHYNGERYTRHPYGDYSQAIGPSHQALIQKQTTLIYSGDVFEEKRQVEDCGCLLGSVLAPNGWECDPCHPRLHFTCSELPLSCVEMHQRCDGVVHCNNASDELHCHTHPPVGEGGTYLMTPPPPSSSKTAYTLGVALCLLVLLLLAALLVYYRRRPPYDHTIMMSGGPKCGNVVHSRGYKAPPGGYRPVTNGGSVSSSSCQHRLMLLPPDTNTTTCSVTCLNSSCGAVNHNHQTEMFKHISSVGSTSSSSISHYPKETLNPPPTPTARAQHPHYHYKAPRVNNNHSYRHYKSRNVPPPPTPCSTDVCDSDVTSSLAETPLFAPLQYTSYASLPQSHLSYSSNDNGYYDIYRGSNETPVPPPPTPHTENGGVVIEQQCAYYYPPPPSPVVSD